MNSISPYDLETGHTYYIESYNQGVRTNKYRGVINNLNACTWYEHNVLEIGNMIEYVNGQETTSACLLYTSPSPRDRTRSRMPSSA